MKLLTKHIIDLVNQDLSKEALIAEIDNLKSQELRNIASAFRSGFHTEDRWALDLEIYDHIRMDYDEEIMTYEEFKEEKSRVAFFQKNFKGGFNG